MSAALAKGQNGPLAVNDVVVSVQLSAAADLSALLVKPDGKVRSDADFVFFNQPTGPGVRLQPGAAGQPASLAVSLNQIPADIDQVRAVITLDDASSNFGRSAPPVARISDASGNQLFEYRIDGLNTESIVIALELYRRQGAWKVRAVGQGYSGGFAALVTDHGVSVDDAPAPTPPPPPAPPAYTPPSQPSQPAYPAAPAQPSYPPAPPQQQQPSYPPAPPQQPSYPPQQQPGYPPQQPSYPPQQQPSYPPQQPAAAYAPPQPAGPPPGQGGEVSLTKGRPVSLTKGQRVTLKKEGGVALTVIRMGLGWDPIKTRGMFGSREVDIDLDASAVMCTDSGIADVAYYGQLTSKDGSIRHQGDNLTGVGEGDDEVINVDLTRVPPHVTTILFIVTSYKGHTFEQVVNAFCRLVDGTTNAELARYSLQGGMPFTGMVMAKVYRVGSDWKLQAIGEGMQAKHPGEAAPQLARFLQT